MCVKEFQGYNCGHCSVPTLRQCPLAQADVNFPACELPAERPIFVNENCHPCARVVWNKKVLEDEEKHRILHQNSECDCEVIFDQEERERRARQQLVKAKERTGDESSRSGYGHGNGGYGRGGRGGNRGGHHGNSRGGWNANGRGGSHRGDFGNGQYNYGGGNTNANTSGEYRGGYRGSNGNECGPSTSNTRAIDQYQQGSGSGNFPEPAGDSSSRYGWVRDAQMNAHQYHGYNGESSTQGQQLPTGYSAYIHPSGISMGQLGAGMKWREQEPPVPPPYISQYSSAMLLPPLPPPMSGFGSAAYQTSPAHNFGNPATYQPSSAQTFGISPAYALSSAQNFGNSGYSAYPSYQTPVAGPGLLYQKAMSEPSTNLESPVMSAGTGYATATSNYQANSVSDNEEEEEGMESEGASNRISSAMNALALAGKDNEHTDDFEHQQTPQPSNSHSNAGEGTSA